MTSAFASSAFAAVTINKQFTAATIDPGETSVLRISIFNSSLVPLTAAAVTDNLPSGVTIANPANIVNNCGFTTVTATSGTAIVIASGGTVPAGSGTTDGTCYLEVTVTALVAGNYPNTIPANGPTGGFTPGGTVSGFQATEDATTVTNTTSATATLAIRSLLNPRGTKSYTPTTTVAGAPFTLTIVLTNPNTASTIPLTTFTDPLPAGMQVAATPGATVNCTGTGAVNGTFTPSAGDTSLTLTGGTIGMGGACTLTVSVVVPTITASPQAFNNAIAANAIGNTRGLGSAAFNQSINITTPIGVAKSFVTASGGSTGISDPVPVNTIFWVRLDITNSATATTPLVITSITDALPTGMVVAATGTPTHDCVTSGGGTNGTLTANAGATSFTLANATVGITGTTRRCRIYVPVTVTAAGAYPNKIDANAVVNPANYPSPTVTATANAIAGITVTKTANPTTGVAPGQPVTFTITINNYSGGPVTGVTLTDNLPAPSGFQMVIANPNNFSTTGCTGGTFGNSPGSSSLTWTGGTVVAGTGSSPGVCRIIFNAVAPANTPVGTTFTNTIPVGGVTGDGGVSNPTGASVGVLMVSAATVTKSFNPTTVVLGGTTAVRVVIANQSGSALTNASLTDNLPAGLVVASVPAATATNCGTGYVITAVPGATSFGISGATVASGATSCQFQVNAVVTTVGGKTNTIPANSLANDQGASNPTQAQANLAVTQGLTGSKSFNPASVAAGGVSRVTVRVTNGSGIPFTNLSITDGPMANMIVATPANATTTCAGSPVITAVPGSNTVTMTGATLAAGGNCDLLFDIKTTGNPGSWPNNIPIGAITTAEGASNTAIVGATLGKLTTVAIAVNKSFNPVSVSAGQPSLLTIDLVNPAAAPSAVTNVTLTDTLPLGMEVYPSPGTSTTCTNATITAVPGSSTVHIAGATIPIGATCSVSLYVTSTKYLNLTNTIPAGAITTTEGLTNSVGTSATLSTLQGAGITKAFSPTSVSVGQPSTLTLRIISTLDPNAPVPVTLHGVQVTDTLPANVTIAPSPNTSTTCTNGTVSATAGASSVSVTGVTLPPGTSCYAYVDVVASTNGAFLNTIPIGALTSDEGYVNQSPTAAILNVLPPPTVTKSFSPNPVTPGTPSTATIVIHNASQTVTLHNVAFVDTLPSGLAVAPTPNIAVSCGGGAVAAPASGSTITLTNGVIAPNGDCTITVDVRSNTPGSYTNTIPANAISTLEGVRNTGPGTATLNVLGPPNVSKQFVPDTIAIGGTSRLTITLGNANATAATLTASFTDTLPTNVVLAASPNVGGTCTLASVSAAGGGSTITYASGATIPAGGCTIAVDVTSSVAGGYTNVVAAGALQTNAGNNGSSASAPLTVTSVPPTLGKAITPASISTGGTASLVITIGNGNSIPIALSSTFNDTMPSGVTTVGGNTGTCTSGVTVGSTSISMASGTAIPPGGCTIVVSITSSTPGTVTNTTESLVTNVGTAPPASAPLTVSAPPTVAKSISPSTIAIGGSATLTIVIGNVNPTAMTLTVPFTDNMPGGVTITTGNSGTCPNVTVTSTALGMATGEVIPSGGCTIVVGITSSTPGSVTNTTSGLTTTTGTAPPGTAPLTITAVAPTLAKSISPSVISVGGTALLTLTLTNGNAIPITLATAFVDNMPGGVTTVGGNSGTCSNVTVASTSVTMAAGATIPTGGCTIVVTITSSTPGTVTNTTGTLSTNAGDAPPASAPLSVSAPPTLGKTINPSTIGIGATATLTITIGNANPTPFVLASAFIDTMPGGVTTVGGNTGTCTGVTVDPGQVTMAANSAVPVGGCTIVVLVTSSTTGTVTNTTGALDTSVGRAPPASAPLTVTAISAALTKTINPSTIVAGGSATLTISLGNTNAIPITLSSAFTDTMPAGVTITAGNSGTCAGVTNTGTVITKAAGSTVPVGGCTIVVTITSATPGTVTNTTSSLVTDAGTTAPASAPLTVTTAVPTLTKTIVPGTIAVGGSATLTLSITNPNATALTLTQAFVDNMPAGVTVTSANLGTCPAQVASTSVTLPANATIPAGGCTIVVTITSSTPGTVTNTTGTLVTTGGTTPPASAPVTVTSVPPTLAKTIAPASIAVGGSATLTITIGNANAVPVTLTSTFTDPMPAGVSTTGGNSGTCPGVTVQPLAIMIANGTSIPAGGCTIVVPITSSTPGTVTNTTLPLLTNLGTAPPASAPITVVASTVSLAKTIAPATINAGGTATLTLVLGNTSGTAVTLTSAFTDTMPSGVTTTSGNSGTCTGVTVTPSAVTMASGSTVPPGGCTIVVSITSSTPGTVTNITGSLSTSGGTAPPASAPITVNAPGPTLAKTISPSTIASGGTATLTLTLGNTGTTPLTLTSAFTDTMPAGVTTTSGNTGTCQGVTVTSTTVTMASGSTIPVGGCTIVVTITSSTPGTVTNTTGTLTTNGGTAPPASAPITVTGTGPTLTKTIAPSSIAPGGTATLTLTLGNPTSAALTLTAPFTDTMPAGVTITSGNTGTCTGVTVSSTALTMASGSTIPPGGCTIVVTITSSTPGTVTNTTGPLSTSGGSAPPASAPITVTQPGGITVTKTIAPATIAPGGTATMTITLGNTTGAPVTLTAPFTDTMPTGVTTTSGNTGTCTGVTVTSTTVTMASGSTIPAGGCTIVVTITSSTPGTVTNITGPLSTSGGNAPPATAPITVTQGGTASLAKAIVPSTIEPGGAATLTITLGNSGSTPLTLTAPFTDPMPAGMTTTSGNTGTCSGVTVTPTLITLPSGSQIPPGGCTIVVGVTSSTLGSVVNVTSELVAGSVIAPAATAPLAVAAPGSSEPIPVDSRIALLLTALLLAALGGARIARRR